MVEGAPVNDLLTWYEQFTGDFPTPEMVDLAFLHTFEEFYFSPIDAGDNETGYRRVWEWLKNQYGLPSPRIIQSIYLRLITNEFTHIVQLVEYVQAFSNISPNLDQMLNAARGDANSPSREELEQKIKSIYVEYLLSGDIDKVTVLEHHFSVQLDLSSEQLQIVYAKLLLEDRYQYEKVYYFLFDRTGIPPSKKVISACYSKVLDTSNFSQDAVMIYHEMLDTGPPSEILLAALMQFIETGNLNHCLFLIDEFGISAENVTDTEKEQIANGIDALIERLWSRRIQGVREDGQLLICLQLSDILNLSQASLKQELFDKFGLTDQDLSRFVRSNANFVALVLSEGSIRLTGADISRLPQLSFKLDLASAELLKTNGFDFMNDMVSENDFKLLFESLKGRHPDWTDETIVIPMFTRAASEFGYKKMFTFISRNSLSTHDALHAFSSIINLYQISGLSANEFYGNILHQVSMENRTYPEGTPHHYLNMIAQSTNFDIEAVLQKARLFPNIPALQQLVSAIGSSTAVFSSWENLKKYNELDQLLSNAEVLDELQELRLSGNERLYQYIATLAFHPDSKIDMRAVIEFWREPESFLAREASHTPDHVQNRKKPSNYVHMPNLDLSADQLRDALVEGYLDELQVFQPLEISYQILSRRPLRSAAAEALGSRRNKVRGTAKNPGVLFSKLNRLFTQSKGQLTDYLQFGELPIELDEVQIEALLYDESFGIARPVAKSRKFVARINKKSDPNGVVAGNDTVNCMPFGDGKNTVYTFNPNVTQFVIRAVDEVGAERTIAQSVLTKDLDVHTLVSKVIDELLEGDRRLHDVLPPQLLEESESYLSGDNVEVSPNYINDEYREIIEVIMKDFFSEYMKHYAESQGLNRSKIPIGQGYTDALSNLPEIDNTFIPQAPVSYSDKTGDLVYVLNLDPKYTNRLLLDRSVSPVASRTRMSVPDTQGIRGIKQLTFEDSLFVGYLEGKVYSDNDSLTEYLFNMENALIAKDINNAAKKRPNMSLKYVDDTGRMQGYLLAWEGILTDEDVELEAREFYDKPCIYVSDVAADRKNQLAGGRLMRAFVELYKRHYLDADNLIPIYAQAREATSFKIVQRQLEKMGDSVGVEFELIELTTYAAGGDTMHPILIVPKRK